MLDLQTNPWCTMWIRPRETIREIVAVNPKFRFFVLSGIYGFPTCLQLAQNFCLGVNYSFFAILIASLVLSTVVGVIGMSISSALLYWTGKWIGGKASFLQVRCAVSWANITNLATIVLWLLLLGYFREFIFYEGFLESPFTQTESLFLSGFFLLQFILSVWSFLLLLHAVGEVQGFSAWKALLNVVIAFLVVVAVVWIVGMVFRQV